MTQKSERRLDAVHVGLLQRSMSAQSVTMTSKEDSSAQLEHLKVTTGRMLRMLETRGPIAVDHDSQVLGQIRAAFIEMLVSAADPQGDFSWTVSDPRAYHLLPIKLIECRDWNALRLLMCDLRFLWRKVVETGPTSVLRTYLVSGTHRFIHTVHMILERRLLSRKRGRKKERKGEGRGRGGEMVKERERERERDTKSCSTLPVPHCTHTCGRLSCSGAGFNAVVLC